MTAPDHAAALALKDATWDALRDLRCASKREAKAVVMVRRDDLDQAIDAALAARVPDAIAVFSGDHALDIAGIEGFNACRDAVLRGPG